MYFFSCAYFITNQPFIFFFLAHTLKQKLQTSSKQSLTEALSSNNLTPDKIMSLNQLTDSIDGNQIGLYGIDNDLVFPDSIKSLRILAKKRKFVYSSKLVMLSENLLVEGICQAIDDITSNTSASVSSASISTTTTNEKEQQSAENINNLNLPSIQNNLPKISPPERKISTLSHSNLTHWVVLLSDIILITRYDEELGKYQVVESPIKLSKILDVHGCGCLFNIFLKDSKVSWVIFFVFPPFPLFSFTFIDASLMTANYICTNYWYALDNFFIIIIEITK